MGNITRTATALVLAFVLALSLAGISYYFPSAQEKTTIFPDLVIDNSNGKIPTYTIGVQITLPYITINADGTVSPQNAPVKRVENHYTLTGDIFNRTLRIQRNNIAVDGESYKIEGEPRAAQAIIIQNVNNVTIKNLEVTDFWYGLLLTNCSDVTINNNKITNIRSRAILTSSCNGNVISDNTLDSIGTAIEDSSADSANSTITKNTITNAAQGITVQGPNSFISENNFSNIYIPIGVNGNYSTISKNNIINGINGIYLTGSFSNIIRNNLANFSESAITINLGTNSQIYENSILESKYAIIIRPSVVSQKIENNIFYHNNFINNTQTIQINSPSNKNYWEHNSEGNYWSNYSNTDNNKDGIGDSPYIIDENNIDNFPLMNPYYVEANLQSNQTFLVYLGIIGLGIFSSIIFGIKLTNRQRKNKNQQN